MMLYDYDKLHPLAKEVFDQCRHIIDSGRLCPDCGGGLEFAIPTTDGLDLDGDPMVDIECQDCGWTWNPADDDWDAAEGGTWDLILMEEDPDWLGEKT